MEKGIRQQREDRRVPRRQQEAALPARPGHELNGKAEGGETGERQRRQRQVPQRNKAERAADRHRSTASVRRDGAAAAFAILPVESMEDITDVLSALDTGLKAVGEPALTPLEREALLTPQSRWSEEHAGEFQKRLEPNWLTFRRMLREQLMAHDTRILMQHVDDIAPTQILPIDQLTREALYNIPQWPDECPRKSHHAFEYTGLAIFFLGVALIFYSIIFAQPLLVMAAAILCVPVALLLNQWRKRLEACDREEYERVAINARKG
jgi:hypothetical protein